MNLKKSPRCLGVAMLTAVMICGTAEGLTVVPPVSPGVRRVMDEAPANLTGASDDVLRGYASRLAAAADAEHARGGRGYTQGWVLAAQNFKRGGDRASAERYLVLVTAHGEWPGARARAWAQLLQWFSDNEQRIARGSEALAYLRQADLSGADHRDVLLIVAMVAEAHAELGDSDAALAVRRAARVTWPRPAASPGRAWARLDRGDAVDHAKAGRVEEARAAFEQAFQTDPSLIEDALSPVMAASFCQRLHPLKRADPAYLPELQREWRREGIREHPLSIVLAGQTAILMGDSSRREDVRQLCEEVLDSVPAWRRAWSADERRRDAEAETVGEEFGNLIQYAKRHGLVDQQAALEEAWRAMRPS